MAIIYSVIDATCKLDNSFYCLTTSGSYKTYNEAKDKIHLIASKAFNHKSWISYSYNKKDSTFDCKDSTFIHHYRIVFTTLK